MKSLKYLDAVKDKYGLKRDNELAKQIGCTPAAVSRYYSGKAVMDDEQCLRVAQALDMENPLPIIAAAGIDRAEKTGQKSLWEVFTKATSLSPLAVALMVGVTTIVTPSPSQAASTNDTAERANLYYVK